MKTGESLEKDRGSYKTLSVCRWWQRCDATAAHARSARCKSCKARAQPATLASPFKAGKKNSNVTCMLNKHATGPRIFIYWRAHAHGRRTRGVLPSPEEPRDTPGPEKSYDERPAGDCCIGLHCFISTRQQKCQVTWTEIGTNGSDSCASPGTISIARRRAPCRGYPFTMVIVTVGQMAQRRYYVSVSTCRVLVSLCPYTLTIVLRNAYCCLLLPA